MFTSATLSLLVATTLAAPAPLQFNNADEFKQALLAEPGRRMDVVNGVYVVLNSDNVTVAATATPKFSWALNETIEAGKCLDYTTVLMEVSDDTPKPFNDGGNFNGCIVHWCPTPGDPRPCLGYEGCTVCNMYSRCF
ncbi:hypothetical protein A1Q2_03377 [Trichosporon asahii var. asahii CBS 8904]|uniref:Uncharacterized protein n=2 Tax=Trichosporon asahii var. asahii TaxID=189963 RepID=K1VNW8_TRIAC|nr:hypothetical protein A1Q1_00117 [Trichosporon asahii var. asahii CBS 2479]EJT53110.1 hypothetical protein A1Q1_00117 [Trichosporon asahii var. asahii CBS 2479]EKD02321.1 hypothetical protein A1Q2_03377 [Trichosporon asahii var. asahii CBS 8904]